MPYRRAHEVGGRTRPLRPVALITLGLVGCSGQGSDELDPNSMDGSAGQVQSDAAILDGTLSNEDAALDAGTSEPMDAAAALDATLDAMTDGALGPNPEAGIDASMVDASSSDAGDASTDASSDDAGDAQACGPKLTCSDITEAVAQGGNIRLSVPWNVFSIESGSVSGAADADSQCGNPEAFEVDFTYQVEGSVLFFAAPQACPMRSCGGLTVTIHDECGNNYDVPISELSWTDCESSLATLQITCGT